jgi:hypothetical protein
VWNSEGRGLQSGSDDYEPHCNPNRFAAAENFTQEEIYWKSRRIS